MTYLFTEKITRKFLFTASTGHIRHGTGGSIRGVTGGTPMPLFKYPPPRLG